ncbi:hypothetical protein DRN74_06845 [Candidatus Micrarchaeota archaeon]|nr:MAG: hypothetical protein DRN74_06845 [Candidatus Micrarchaeota archaeon]
MRKKKTSEIAVFTDAKELSLIGHLVADDQKIEVEATVKRRIKVRIRRRQALSTASAAEGDASGLWRRLLDRIIPYLAPFFLKLFEFFLRNRGGK